MKKYLSILIILAVSFTSNSQETEDRYIIKNLSINNAYSNFGTSFYGNKLVYASPAKRNYIINNVWKPNNQPFLDLYVGDINSNGDLSNTKKFSDVVNTKYHEADVTFTKDLKTVYFTRSNYFEGKYGKDSLGINRLKLFKAKVDASGNWFNVEPLPFNDDNYSVGHPSLSEDEQTLYFVSDMPGTMGETDIFKVAVYTDGTYGNPENLGPEVNTVNKEMFPYIDGNDELYYSSNGKDGEGMLDIYVNKILPDGILPAINLGKSINSDKDDFAFIINKEKREGYFSSNRSGGKGDDDIYYFKEEKPADFKCTETLQFVVKNKKTGEIVPNASINIFENEAIVSELVTNNKGICNFEANCLTNYNVEASGNFFITKQLSVKTSNKNQQTNVITIELMPDEFIVIRDKVMIDINTIYFDYDKFNIRPDAALELNKVVEVMKKYPELKVEAGSHTDSRGPDAYNDVLSEKRANSTVEYIVSKGISPDRISGKGYGEKQLTNKCSNGVKCTSEEHQLNRRTEFVIVNPEVIN